MITKLDYKSIKKSDAVVVLCGGPSVTNNATRIKEYVKNNNAILFGSNYSFETIGIKSDYTYVANDFKLHENIAKINNDIIIPAKLFNGEFPPEDTKKLIRKHVERGYKVFQAGDIKNPTTYTIKKGVVKILPNGEIPYSRLSSAGHGCMVVSLLCKPKRLLLVGLDGPKDSTFNTKIMFDGKEVKYAKPQKHENFRQHFINVILPTMRHYGVQVETFSDVRIYDMDKREMQIKVI